MKLKPNKLVIHDDNSISYRVNNEWTRKARYIDSADYWRMPIEMRRKLIYHNALNGGPITLNAPKAVTDVWPHADVLVDTDLLCIEQPVQRRARRK